MLYGYDDTDRAILTQDGVQRASGEWTYSVPDSLGREVLRGTCTTVAGKAVTQNVFSGKTVSASYRGPNGGYAVLADGAVIALAGGLFLRADYYDGYRFQSLSDFTPAGTGYEAAREGEGYGKRYTGGSAANANGSG